MFRSHHCSLSRDTGGWRYTSNSSSPELVSYCLHKFFFIYLQPTVWLQRNSILVWSCSVIRFHCRARQTLPPIFDILDRGSDVDVVSKGFIASRTRFGPLVAKGYSKSLSTTHQYLELEVSSCFGFIFYILKMWNLMTF